MPTDREIYRCLFAIAEQGALVPGFTLTAQERMALSARCSARAPHIVAAVARGLRLDPEAFAALPVDPAELEDGQGRATAYFWLMGALRHLARVAEDNYLYEQARVTSRAQELLRAVRDEGRALFPQPLQERRAAALRPALAAAAERQRKPRPSGATGVGARPRRRRGG